jgi:hypothetical protein
LWLKLSENIFLLIKQNDIPMKNLFSKQIIISHSITKSKFIVFLLWLFSITLYSQTADDNWKLAKYAAVQKEDNGSALFYLSETAKLDPRIEEDYKSVAELYPGFFFLRGWVKFGLEDYVGCLSDMNRCLEFGYHDSVNVFLYKAKSKRFLDDVYGGILEINKAIDISPKAGVLYLMRGEMKLKLGDKTGACLDWSKSGELGSIEAYEWIKKYCQ